VTFAKEIHNASIHLTLEDIVSSAAQASWAVENNIVVLLNAAGFRERNLRTEFQALGLEVFAGVNSPEVGDAPVIVIDAKTWQRPQVQQEVKYWRLEKPNAAICLVTGRHRSNVAVQPIQHPVFDDARAVMWEAGIGFLSIWSSKK
jgi:hypothetical protein